MLRSLLIPLDGTRFSEQALPWAEGIARATGAEIHLAHVHVPPDPDPPGPGDEPPVPPGWTGETPTASRAVALPPRDDAEVRSREWSYLDRLTSRVKESAATQVDAALLDGQVSPSLSAYASEVGADAVILATRSLSPVRRVWNRSVADALIRSGRVPVMAVRAGERDAVGPPRTIRRILVPLDGSTLAEAALAGAAELAWACSARVILLQVVSTRFPTGNGLYPSLAHHWIEALQEGEDYLERVAARLQIRGIPVDTMVLAGPDPARTIQEVAVESDADLIAMATHGYSGLRRALLGSVTRDVIRGTRIPVLVQRAR